MKELCDQLYQLMIEDCERCRGKQLDILTELSCCFQICKDYWERVRDDVANYEFDCVNDEIHFFKNIKPRFTSEIMYFGFVSFAELSREKETDAYELQKFWDNESLRKEKFIKGNQEFYTYYKNGFADKDEIYFTREKSDLSNFLKARPYDLENRAATSHDYLVATILALEKYQHYLQLRQNGLRQ